MGKLRALVVKRDDSEGVSYYLFNRFLLSELHLYIDAIDPTLICLLMGVGVISYFVVMIPSGYEY